MEIIAAEQPCQNQFVSTSSLVRSNLVLTSFGTITIKEVLLAKVLVKTAINWTKLQIGREREREKEREWNCPTGDITPTQNGSSIFSVHFTVNISVYFFSNLNIA